MKIEERAKHMYAAVTQVKTKSLERLTDAIRKTEIPDISKIPGFVAYYVVPGKDCFTTIAIFHDATGVEQWRKMSRASLKHLKKHIDTSEAVQVIAGHVVFSRTAHA